MSALEMKKVEVKSLFKSIPVVFAILGAIIGIFTFFIFPTEIAAPLGFGARLLSWVIFVVLYTLIMVVGIAVVALLYNWVVSKVGGIVINFDKKDEE